MKKIWLFSVLLLCIYLPSPGQKHNDNPKLAIERLKKDIPELMKKADIPGMSVALVHDGKQRNKDTLQRIDENGVNNLGYSLLRFKKLDDALEVFRQNTVDFPVSYNVWDSFAEACMNKGDKALAIKYYEKSVELNPANENGKEQLKKLRQ